MASTAMPVSTMQGAQFTSPLYAGNTGPSGMPVPIGTQPRNNIASTPGLSTGFNPTAGTAPQAPAVPVPPAQAPSALTVTPNPGTGGTGVNPTGTTPGSSTNPTGLTPSQQSALDAQQSKTYGASGSVLTNYLNSGAGYNGAIAQQTINATDNAMQQQINQQFGGLQNSLSAAGLSPNSSASALATAGFLSNASAQENQVAAQQYSQMYSQSQSDYLAAMEGLLTSNSSLTQSQISNLNSESTLNDTKSAGNILGLL